MGWRRRRWVRVKLGLTAPSRGSSGGRGTDAPRHDPACARSGVKLSGRAVMRTGDSPVRDPGQPSHAVEIEPRAEQRAGVDDAPLREQGVVSPAEAAASPASPTMVGPTTTPARTSGGTTEHRPLTGATGGSTGNQDECLGTCPRGTSQRVAETASECPRERSHASANTSAMPPQASTGMLTLSSITNPAIRGL